MSGIRFSKTGTIYRPTINSAGQRIVPDSGTSTRLALWRRKLQVVVGGTGEVRQVDAVAFFPAGTDIQRRDRVTVSGESFLVMEVIPAEDDLGTQDHIGAQLREDGES